MPRTAWPTPQDVAAVLPSSVPSTQAQRYLNSAVENVEDRTGHRPFLCDDATSTRTFFPPDGRSGRSLLDLKCGVTGITSVKVDVYEDGSGTELLQGTEWNALPIEAPDHRKPYTQILFGRNGPNFTSLASTGDQYDYRVSTANPTVTVTGFWGFGPNIPEDLWDAVCDYAAARCVKQAQILGPVRRQKQGEREQEIQNSTGWASLNEAENALARAIAKYSRLS